MKRVVLQLGDQIRNPYDLCLFLSFKYYFRLFTALSITHTQPRTQTDHCDISALGTFNALGLCGQRSHDQRTTASMPFPAPVPPYSFPW